MLYVYRAYFSQSVSYLYELCGVLVLFFHQFFAKFTKCDSSAFLKR